MSVPFSWSNQNTADGSLQELNDEISTKIGSLVIDSEKPKEFKAAMNRQLFGKFSITSVRATPHRITQKVAHRTETSDLRYGFHYIREGTLTFEQNGHRLVVEPGDFVLLDNFRSYEFWTPMNVCCVSLDVPEMWLSGRLRDPAARVMMPVNRTSLWARTFGAVLSAMGDSRDQAEFARHGIISDQVGSFVTLLFEGDPELLSGRRMRLHQSILETLRGYYTDVELTPEFVANFVGISKRSLCLTLASAGTTFSKELARLRIDRARKLLGDPNFKQLSIAEIGWRCGFADPSYFARCFSRHLNCSPRSFRRNSADLEHNEL